MHVENVQTAIQHRGRSVVEEPAVGAGIPEVFAGKVCRPNHHSPGHALVFTERPCLNSINIRIDAAEISQPDLLARVLLLVPAKCKQALPPIQVAVSEQLIAVPWPNERIEIR